MEANFSLHPLFTDHAVLPRDRVFPVFGRGMPGQPIKLSLAGQQVTTRSDATGWWEARFEPIAAGGPHTLSISTPSKQLFRRNILIGDVWLASGQSNMEWPLCETDGGKEAVAKAKLPRLRLFTMPRRGSLVPEPECDGRWEECTSKTAAIFSAVAFHFGRTLVDALDVPIGIINASWGGTMALPWTPADFIRGKREFGPLATPIGKVTKLIDQPAPVIHEDTGNDGEARGWAAVDFPEASLHEMPVPGMWQTRGMAFNGAVWFRRAVEIPAAWAGKSLRLDLGAIDDFDTTYVNGTPVGSTGGNVPDAWRTQRRYSVPATLVRAGKNVIAVRVFDRGGDGGFAGPAATMRLYPEGRAAEAIPLAGKWRVIVERSIPLPPRENARPGEMNAHEYPSGLFNGMIAPLVRLPIRGVIWYQGESDVDRAHLYRAIFMNLITAWRAAWGGGDFPFLFVQLANWLARKTEPGDDAWAELREAQALALRLPAAGMVVAADVGDEVDIHPREKRTVGERLALAALAIAYARAMPHSGPVYAGHAVERGTVRIRFNHAEAIGLRVRGDGGLSGFAIAGSDRNFRWAEARIDGANVVVSHPEVPAPLAVRYAWEANPALTLENGVGLPAAPFRTDDWPGLTAGKF